MDSQIQAQLPRFLIEAIRERHQTSAEQLVDPVFIMGRVTCTEVLVENPDSDEEETGECGMVKKRRNYMYSYRMELIDSSGEKITGVLRPGLHERASEGAFTQGVRVKLAEWRVRETVTRGGEKVMFLDLEEFEVMAQEKGEDVDETGEGGAQSPVGKSASYVSCASSRRSATASMTSTAREVEEQLRNESRCSQWEHGGVVETSSPALVRSEQSGSGISKPGEPPDDEENYDDGADYLLAMGSFSTPPLSGAQVQLASETALPKAPQQVQKSSPDTPLQMVASETALPKAPQQVQKSSPDTPLQMVKLSNGEPIALSTLGKRFYNPKMSWESLSPFSSPSPTPPTAKKPRIDAGTTQHQLQHPPLAPAVVSKLNIPPNVSPPTPAPAFSSATAIRASGGGAPTTPTTPSNIWSLLRPCPLADLFSRPHGSKVDILAIIHSIDTHLITRNKSVKRDCRLVDPTSPLLVPAPTQPHLKQPHHNELKPTILSVWVKPQSFTPHPGALVAFRGLTVHRYAGRSLNAFSDVAGSVWYLENPGSEIDGAEEMGEWWADRCMREVAEELDRREELERREKEVEGKGKGKVG